MDEIRLGVERHTFTILAKCPRTGALGIAIATYSLGVGGYCPAINPQAGVLASQAFADPRLRPIGMQILESGSSAAQALKGMQDADSYADYRQIGIVDAQGDVAAYTGPKARDWAGHETGVGYVAMGNVMVGPQVVDAMASTGGLSARLSVGNHLSNASMPANKRIFPGTAGHCGKRTNLLR